MQFNVPQFIEIEDKIFGPLTLKQFMLFLGGAIATLFLWYIFRLWVVIIVALPLFGFLAATVFLKINGRPFFTWLTSLIQYFTKPKIYVWKQKK